MTSLAGRPPEVVPRPAAIWLLLGAACLFALAFAQHPGDVIFDTKLDLVQNPSAFLARALHLWDPSAGFGQVQNQAVGYVFPMGPFFLLAHTIGVPAWITQRLWIGLLLAVAMWGMARLAAALRVGTPGACVLAGIAYALSPFFVGLIGFTSAAVLPAAMMPWAVVPLIGGAAGGSPRRAAARSGLAIVLMGGVNATSALCVLVPPSIYLVTRARGPRKRALMFWWFIAVVLASFWWLASLVFQGKYGINVTTFTETPAVTESTTALTEVLRGTGNWLGYLNLGAPWVPSSWTLATSAIAIAATTLVAVAGMAGLTMGRFPERRFVASTFVFAAFAVGAGYTGALGGVASDVASTLLAGALAPFRNIYKFEPDLAAATALGLAALLARVQARTDPGRRRGLALRGAAFAALLACVVVSALPMLQGRATTAGGFKRVPAYWTQAADWLGAHSPRNTSLLVPASAFGEYQWGRPIDEPMQSLEQGPWAARTLQPLGSVSNTRALDDLEHRIVDRRDSPGLRATLRRMGVRYLVARNDLDWRRTGGPRPILVRQAMRAAGLTRVARFGPRVPELRATRTTLPDLGIGREEGKLRAVEIYAVAPNAAPISTYAVARTTVISGGPESVAQAQDDRVVGKNATVLAADLAGAVPATGAWVVSDALRRARADFGLIRDNTSYTLAPGEHAAGQAITPQLLQPQLVGHEAVALPPSLGGSVTASSYGSWLLQLPELQPANAFDRSASTVWVAGDAKTSEGQWVQANLPAKREVYGTRVRLLHEGSFRPRIVRLRVTTDHGSRITDMRNTERLQPVNVAPGLTAHVRITLDGVVGERAGAVGAGLRDVYLPGNVGLRRFVRPPQERAFLAAARATGRNPIFLFSRLTADPFDLLRRDEEPQVRRQFSVPTAGAFRVTGRAAPAAGAALTALLTRTRGLRVTATSSYGEQPRYRAANAFDGTATTAWIAAPSVPQALRTPSAPGLTATNATDEVAHASPVPAVVDRTPTLRVTFAHRRTLDRVRVLPAHGFGVAPKVIRITTDRGEVRDVDVRGRRLVRFKATRAQAITLTFPSVVQRFTNGPDGVRIPLPVGVSEIDFPALRSERIIPLPPRLPVATSCGSGPGLLVDRRIVRTKLKTTAGAATSLLTAPLTLCGQASLRLRAGVHTIRSLAGSGFVLNDLVLRPVKMAAPVVAAPRSATVQTWTATARTVRVSSGAKTYLEVHENASLGWTATLDGQPLASQQLDGWQQSFVVPAGAAGIVRLTFAPDHEYRLLLLVGLLFVAGLGLLALVPARTRERQRSVGVAGVWPPPVGPAPAPTGALRALWGAAVIGFAAAVCAPVIFLLPVLAWIAVKRGHSLPIYGAAALLAAGLITAVAQSPFSGDHRGAFSWVAQLLAAISFSTVMVSLVQRRGWTAQA